MATRPKGRHIVEQPKLPKQRSMEMLPPEGDEEMRPASASSTSSSRPNSSSSRRAPPINKQDRVPRTPTPTKSVLLEAVKRKEEPNLVLKKDKRIENTRLPIKGSAAKSRPSKETSSDEYDTDLEDEPKEKPPSPLPKPIKAPNELILEFLDSMMDKNYITAEKLCRMILLYEPNNQQAAQFQPLLEEKIRQQEELDGDTGSGEDTSTEDSDDDEGSTDDEGVELTSSDGSSSSSEEDNEEDEEEEEEDRSTIQDEHKV